MNLCMHNVYTNVSAKVTYIIWDVINTGINSHVNNILVSVNIYIEINAQEYLYVGSIIDTLNKFVCIFAYHIFRHCTHS